MSLLPPATAIDTTLSADLTLTMVGIAAGLATSAGGLMAFALRKRQHLLLAFSAGAVLSVSLFELFPEALTLSMPHASIRVVTGWLAIGFLGALVLDQALPVVFGARSSSFGHLGAGLLTVHSLLDGVGIGISFQVSEAAGFIVAAAVLAHDVADGMNTVNVSLNGQNTVSAARAWLVADAAAPAIGIVATRFLSMPEVLLPDLLAVFSGSFLYIGAGRLLPDSRRAGSGFWTTLCVGLGFGLVTGVVALSKR